MTVVPLDDLKQSLEYYCRARQLSELTMKQYVSSLERFYHWAVGEGLAPDLSEASPAVIERHLASYAQGKRPATLRHHFSGLQAVFKWDAGREGYVSPMRFMDSPKVPEAPKDTVDVVQFMKVLSGLPRARYRDAAIIAMLFDAGLRVSELVGMDWDAIDWKARTVEIKDAKNGEIRVVPFSPVTGLKLDTLRTKRNRDVPWVFSGKKGNRLTRSGVLQMVKQLFDGAGIPGISPHDLRHSFATAYLKANPQGTDTLMAIGGWKSEAMVRHYSRKGRQARAVEDFRRNSPLAKA